MTALSLVGTHLKYGLLEVFRIPIAVIGGLAFPALALLFFVVPQRQVAEDPAAATAAIIAMSVFAIMSNALFSVGLQISEEREKPWDAFVRTLPVSASVRILAMLAAATIRGLAALVPVLVIGAMFTAARAEPGPILLGLLAITATGLPFMLIGAVIGYAMPQKAAIAVVQIVMFLFAFAGGLFLPPMFFADWLEKLSRIFPSRQARELVIAAVQGGSMEPWVWLGLIAWTVLLFGVAVLLYRGDRSRRFR